MPRAVGVRPPADRHITLMACVHQYLCVFLLLLLHLPRPRDWRELCGMRVGLLCEKEVTVTVAGLPHLEQQEKWCHCH